MSKIEQLKFAKVNYTKKRNQRRAERLALKSNKSENTLQKQVEKLLDTLGVRWLHIPNDVLLGLCFLKNIEYQSILDIKYRDI